MRKTIYLFKFQVSYVHFIMLPLVQNSTYPLGFPWWLVKSLLAMQKTQEMRVQSLGWEDIHEDEVATHPVFLLGNPMDRGAWWATVHRVTKSWTQLKQLSRHAHTPHL